jgi:hypothetical protein
MRTTNFEEHARRNELLRQKIKRVAVDVRDAMKILDLKSTSAALYELREQVKLGMIEYEEPKDGKTYGKFYLS